MIYMLVIDIPSLLIGLVLGGIIVYAFKKGDRHE
nr:MAG TPA: Myc target protein 1 [Caudoviricetes sp.]